LIKTVEETQQTLDEFLNVVQMLKASPHIKGILKKANEMEAKFITIQDCLENWMKCQRGWLYLEPIFSSEDIIKKLPQEHGKFQEIDSFFRATMEQATKETKPFDSPDLDLEKLNGDFDGHNKTLEVIQKALTDYLETKRRAFARFYFLSDEELLEILSDTKEPTKVQPHMSKCFEAIQEVVFSPNHEVTAMISAEKERVDFVKVVDVNEGDKKGNVEKWLLEVESVMQKTLFHICKQSIKDTGVKRTEWVKRWPGQIILAVN
jgi:dynein heavy chain